MPQATVQFIQASQRFAFSLYDAVAAAEKGNFVISPVLFSIGLALLLNGADPQAREEITHVLELGAASTDLTNAAVAELLRDLEGMNVGDSQVFALATSLWASYPLEFTGPFLEAARRHFSAEVCSVAPEQLPARVSEWALRNTRGLVDMQIEPSDYLLLFAAYFKGKWETPFEKGETTQEPFFSEDGARKRVPMMKRQDWFSHLRGRDYQVVELPFSTATACFLLPNKGRSLRDAERSLVTEMKNGAFQESTSRPGLVRLPRFSLRYGRSFMAVLRTLGMEHLFTSFESLRPAVTHPEGARLEEVLQNSIVSVDEEGAEAASVLAVVMVGGALPVPKPIEPFEFIADRPFCFWITDKTTGAILFMGRLTNPDSDTSEVEATPQDEPRTLVNWLRPWRRKA